MRDRLPDEGAGLPWVGDVRWGNVAAVHERMLRERAVRGKEPREATLREHLWERHDGLAQLRTAPCATQRREAVKSVSGDTPGGAQPEDVVAALGREAVAER